MKYLNRILTAMAISVGFLAVSCEDQPDAFVPTEGVPSVDFIRYADKDVVIDAAFMQEVICIVGQNLRSINQLWFNDQQAVLNTSFMTENTLVVSVPRELPKVQTDKIYMITAAKDTVTYDFKVMKQKSHDIYKDTHKGHNINDYRYSQRLHDLNPALQKILIKYSETNA